MTTIKDRFQKEECNKCSAYLRCKKTKDDIVACATLIVWSKSRIW